MPLIAPSSYEPPSRLWNGHLQTIIPSLFRKVSIPYARERIETPDDDFLDLDWAYANDKLRMMNDELADANNSSFIILFAARDVKTSKAKPEEL